MRQRGLYTNLFLSSKKIQKIIENPKLKVLVLGGKQDRLWQKSQGKY
jgi:hypothetical protein